MMDVPPPEVLKKPLVVPNKLLMGPGPSNCPPRILHSLSLPVLGHLHPECLAIMDEIKEGLKYIFQTKNPLTLALSASGHGGIDAVMCNLIEPEDKVLIAVNGIWGERASYMATRYGGIVSQLKTEVGYNFSLAEIERAIVEHKPSLFFIVQGESSTGVYQPLEGIGNICHKYNCLFAVDTVASLGGVPVLADKWEIDAIYTGSQKVLGAPPGITPMSFSSKAQEKIFNRKSPPKVYYLDMRMIGDYWGCYGNPRIYHHTISSTLLYALRESLAMVAEEGMDNVIKRHQECAKKLREGLEKMSLQLFVADPAARLPTVTTIKVPGDIHWKEVIDYAMKNYLLELGGGLGPTVNRVFRVGLMGYNATMENVDLVLKVVGEAIRYVRTKSNNKL